MPAEPKDSQASRRKHEEFDIVCGDARDVLATLDASSVDTVVCSPPYYGQRDYASPQQIGHEPSDEDYVAVLVDVFRQVRRVIKPTGSLWLVLGDKYVSGRLLGMPWRVALGLQQDGWTLRSDVIWHKPNAMPSAVKTRPTTDHEYVFFLDPRHSRLLLRCRCDSRAARDVLRAESDARWAQHLGFAEGRPKRARTREAAICTTAAGTRPFIRRGVTNGRSGRFPYPSIARPISPSFQNRSSGTVYWRVARPAAWCWTRFAAAEPLAWCRSISADAFSVSTAPSPTAIWPGGD